MKELAIRASEEADFEAILALLQQLWPDSPVDGERTRSVFCKGLRSESQTYLSATAGGRVIAFASLSVRNSLWQEGNLAHIDEIVVDDECRGRGVGTALMQALMAVARERSCRRIELDSAFSRESAHAFYRSQGFQKRGFVFSFAL